jgi:hypothetical protein
MPRDRLLDGYPCGVLVDGPSGHHVTLQQNDRDRKRRRISGRRVKHQRLKSSPTIVRESPLLRGDHGVPKHGILWMLTRELEGTTKIRQRIIELSSRRRATKRESPEFDGPTLIERNRTLDDRSLARVEIELVLSKQALQFRERILGLCQRSKSDLVVINVAQSP